MKRSAPSNKQRQPTRPSTAGESDEKILKSYRLRKSVVQRIERIRIGEGQRTGKVPSAAEAYVAAAREFCDALRETGKIVPGADSRIVEKVFEQASELVFSLRVLLARRLKQKSSWGATRVSNT